MSLHTAGRISGLIGGERQQRGRLYTQTEVLVCDNVEEKARQKGIDAVLKTGKDAPKGRK